MAAVATVGDVWKANLVWVGSPKLDLVESKCRRFSGDEWWAMVRVGVAIRWGMAPPSDVTYEGGCIPVRKLLGWALGRRLARPCWAWKTWRWWSVFHIE